MLTKRTFFILAAVIGVLFAYSVTQLSAMYPLKDSVDTAFHGDSLALQAIAVNLSRGDGYRTGILSDYEDYKFDVVETDLQKYHFRPNRNNFYSNVAPVYPVFLAAIYKMLGVYPIKAEMIQLLLLALAVALIPLLSYLSFGRLGIPSGTIASSVFLRFFSPDPSKIMSESLFVFTLVLWTFFYIFYEKKPTIPRIFLLTALLGVLMLIKGSVAFLPLIILPYLFIRIKPFTAFLGHGIVFVLVFFFVTTSWSVYATAQSRIPVMTSGQVMYCLLDGNNEDTIATGAYSAKWRRTKSAAYLYNRPEVRDYSRFKKAIIFLKINYRRVPEMLANKVHRGFHAKTRWVLFFMFIYYMTALIFNRRNKNIFEFVPLYPLLLFFNILLINLIFFGSDRYVSVFVYAFLIPACYAPFYIGKILYEKYNV